MRLSRLSLFNPETAVGALLLATLFVVLAIVAVRTLRFFVNRALARGDSIDRTAALFLSQVAEITIFIVFIALYATLVPALQSLGAALLASVSILSIVVGIAAQSTLGNVIAGFVILLYRPFQVGDEVVVNAPTGKEIGIVETLTLGYTLLRTEDKRRIFVPNSIMATQVTVNLTIRDPRVMATVPVRFAPQHDIDHVRGVLLDVAKAEKDLLEIDSTPVTQLSGEFVEITLKAYCGSRVEAKRAELALLEAIKKRFDRESLVIR